ncbi:tetratricopeptide repeat protein [uncultured Algoriphagus sp.]|uniref:tetratricopeptide repeat protein n=1 Tax=uncultured Algoriphagus sp. TaxID=417365 RepID=UPI0030EB8253|tara:strand:+ start:22147 stop:22662 length:516 start_codon:yes stop_codon:yes gene_type:complete
MKKFLYVLSIVLLLTFILFVIFRKQFDLLKELDLLKIELRDVNENEFDFTDFYILEDALDSIIDNGGYEDAKSIIDSLLNNGIKEEFKYSFYFRKGKILYLQSKYPEAIQYFNSAINSTQKLELESYFWRSFSLAKIGKCDEALEDYKFVNFHSLKYKDFEGELYEICDSL